MSIRTATGKLAATAVVIALAMPIAALAQSTPPSPSFWDTANLVPGNPVTASHPWEVLQTSGAFCETPGSTLTANWTGGGGAWIGKAYPYAPNLPFVFRAVSSTTSASQGMTIQAGGIGMHPGTGRCAVLRFIAPADGVYKIAGEFFAPIASQTNQPNYVNTRVLDKGVQIAAGVVSKPNGIQSWNWPNTHQFQLQTGQAIDFAVDNSGGLNGIASNTVQLVGRVTWNGPLGFKASNFDFEGDHGCAIEQGTSKLYCWGRAQTSGLMLGNNSTANKDRAVPATALNAFIANNNLGPIQNIQVGVTNNCVRTAAPLSKTVCFGENSQGESGQPSSGSVMTDVTLQLGSYQGARLDGRTGCVITASQQVQCWGSNQDSGGTYPGKLGWLTPANSHTLRPAIPNLGGATDVAPGGTFSCAVVDASKKVICWGKTQSGWENQGLMGNGAGGPTLPHPDNSGGFYQAYVKTGLGVDLTGIKRVVVQGTHACGLKTSGQLYCWGINSAAWGSASSAPNNPGPSSNMFTYAGLSNFPNGVTDFAMTRAATCVVAGPGALVFCQGRNDDGQVGQLPAGSNKWWSFNPAFAGTFGSHTVTAHLTSGNPTPMPSNPLSQIQKIRGGNSTFCALKSTGDIYCWGTGTSGQLGNGASVSSHLPVKVIQ